MVQLYDLPLEIRFMIYDMIFQGMKIRAEPRPRTRRQTSGRPPVALPPLGPHHSSRAETYRVLEGRKRGRPEVSDETAPHLAIPLTCRALRNDATAWRAAMQANVSVVFESVQDIRKIKRVVSAEEARNIKSVYISPAAKSTCDWNPRTVFYDLRTIFRNLKVVRTCVLMVVSGEFSDSPFIEPFERHVTTTGEPISASGIPTFHELEKDLADDDCVVYCADFPFHFERILCWMLHSVGNDFLHTVLDHGFEIDIIVGIVGCYKVDDGYVEVSLRGRFSSTDCILRLEHDGRIAEIRQDLELLHHKFRWRPSVSRSHPADYYQRFIGMASFYH